MMNDPNPKKKPADTDDDIPTENDDTYIEPEAIDTREPEDLDSDEEDV